MIGNDSRNVLSRRENIEQMLLDAHAGVTYVRLCRPVGGPLSRRSGNESPERVEASAGTSSGFLAFSLAKRPDREKRTQFAKNNQVSGLWKVSGWSTFPVTSKGKPSDGPKRRETVGMVGWKVGRPAGRSNRRDGKPEGRFNPKPKEPEATGGRQTERGSFGIVERTDG
jgi:hypothetical protein